LSLQPGAILARKYRIVRTIGQGGMGVVVEAMHEELDQHVAVKLMAEHAAANVEWAARFQREARAAARIKSEHVVRVYDVGKLETGQPYMVMELLEGEDLGAVLERVGKLDVPLAVDYVLQACEALAEAHANGIVHRDLKPANLFVTSKSDGSACVKVLDFGISKVTGDMRGVTVTSTSAIVGSPLYMSPEQMKASKNVDARTDIWSLGVILHELVTGRPPFDGETAPELCALVLTAPPSRLSDSLPTAPPTLEAVVLKCLEKDATKRFADVAELAAALAPLAVGAAKLSPDRIARILVTKARQQSMPAQTERRAETERIAITPDKTDVASDIGDTVASGPRIEVPQGPTMLSAGQGRPKPPQPTQKLPAPKPEPAKSHTLVQGPIPTATDPGLSEPRKTGSTAAAWGGSDTGARGLDAPKRSWLPFALAGGGILLLGGIAFAVSMSKSTSPANPSPPAPIVTKSIETSSATATPTTIATADSDAGESIDIAALPKATATQTAAVRPPTTGKPTASNKVKPPTSDTSEFGGRK
jgi:serine/threonine-protein kinase